MPILIALIISTLLVQTTMAIPNDGNWHQMEVVVDSTLTIVIEDKWVIGNTVQLKTKDNILYHNGVRYDAESRTVIVLDTSIIGKESILIWRSADPKIPLEYSYNSMDTVDDSTANATDSIATIRRERSYAPTDPWTGMNKSGYIKRGIKFGETGSGISSGFHLEMSGSPTPGLTIEAIVDDSSIPLTPEGGSVSISELDKILFRAQTKRFAMELGDWDLNWSDGEFQRTERRLKGGRIAFHNENNRIELLGASSNGTYRFITLSPRTGDLGPYELTDKHSRSGIVIESGSEIIHLNGRKLKRGRFYDYQIDYSNGRITFNPNILITTNSRIEAEYNYHEGTYPIYLYGTKYDLKRSANSNYTIFGLTESSDSNNPLSFDMTHSNRSILELAGDDNQIAVIEGIDSVGIGKGDYIWHDTLNTRALKFSTPDSIGRPTGYLNAQFSRQSGGEYEQHYDHIFQIIYFTYVGSGLGNFTPTRSVPLPERLNISGIILKEKFNNLTLNFESAVSEKDLNAISNLDDDDNIGGALKLNAIMNFDDAFLRSASLNSRYRSENFNSISKFTSPDHQHRWNATDSLVSSEEFIEASVITAPTQTLQLQLSGGMLRKGDYFNSNRGEAQADFFSNNWTVNSSYDIVNTNYVNSKRNVIRQSNRNSIAHQFEKIKPYFSLNLQETKEFDSTEYNIQTTWLEQEAGVIYQPTHRDAVEFSVNHSEEKTVPVAFGVFNSDTWYQRLNWRADRSDGNWAINLQTNQETKPSKKFNNSASMLGRYSPSKSDWELYGDYRFTTGRERASIQTASYVGEGRGTHIYRDGRYIQDPDGDFILRTALTDTLRNSFSADFNGRAEWNATRRSQAVENKVYPLTSYRIVSNQRINTSGSESFKRFIFAPDAMRESNLNYSENTIMQDFGFYESSGKGDVKFTTRFSENRDRYLSGASSSKERAGRLRLRKPLGGEWWLRLEPEVEVIERSYAFNNTEVQQLGSDTDLYHFLSDNRIEWGIVYGYAERQEFISAVKVIDRKLQPRINWNTSNQSMLRFSTEWRHLTSNATITIYDLNKGFAIGDNFTHQFFIDWRIGRDFILTANFRHRQREGFESRTDGIIELTANF